MLHPLYDLTLVIDDLRIAVVTKMHTRTVHIAIFALLFIISTVLPKLACGQHVQVEEQPRIIAIAAEGSNSLFIKSDGSLWAMGRFVDRQSEDSPAASSAVPLHIADDVATATLSGSQTLFVKSDGSLWGIGSAYDNYSGDGVVATRATPVFITDNVVTAATGVCTLWIKKNGSLWGYGNIFQSAIPILIDNDVNAISVGSSHAMFIKTDGSLWGLGYNTNGQLGVGTTSNRVNPIPVHVTDHVIAVATGYTHTLFITDDHVLWATGSNGSGQLGVESPPSSQIYQLLSPMAVTDRVISVVAGRNHSLFIMDDGSLWGMGNNTSNLLGLINYSNTSQQKLPVKIANNVVCAAAGTSHSLYLESDGRLWGMGDNRYGQLGIGSYDIELYLQTYIKTVPGKMSNDAVMAIAAGTNRSSLFIKTDGSLWAAGNNSHGQLGLPLKATAFLDYQGRVTERVNAIAVGTVHSLFIEDDGSLWAMGSNSYGQLGNENLVERNTPPIPVTVAGKVIAIAAGTNHSLFIKEDGSLWRMPGLETYTPELIPDTGRVIAVSTRSAHSLFINENGSLWGWGANHSGQLGDGSYTSRTSPVHIADSVAAVTAGKNHSLFILHDGSLWAMGANMHGQLGDGTLESRNTPVYIADDVVAVDAGQSRTVFIKSDGSLWSMGRNEPFSGPLGVGTTDDYITTPAKVAENVATASAGWEYTLYITSNGEMWGVGLNSGGQLTGLSRYLVKSESLHVTIDPPAAGSAIGAGQYHPGDPATISATPQPGYYFHHWDGVELDDPTTNPLTLAMHHDRKLTAVFRRIVEYDAIDRELSPAAQNYTIHVTSDRSWTVESHLYWASVDPVAGSGNGVVTVTVAENRGASLRSGAISIGGWLHILIQAPAADTRWRTAGVRAAGWLSLDWFGWFIDTGDWIYHRERGWLYCTGDDTTSIHIHDPAQDIWCWTAAEIYPWTFAFYPVGGAWIAPE